MYIAALKLIEITSTTIIMSLISERLVFWSFRLAFALDGIAALIALGLLTPGRH